MVHVELDGNAFLCQFPNFIRLQQMKKPLLPDLFVIYSECCRQFLRDCISCRPFQLFGIREIDDLVECPRDCGFSREIERHTVAEGCQWTVSASLALPK